MDISDEINAIKFSEYELMSDNINAIKFSEYEYEDDYNKIGRAHV